MMPDHSIHGRDVVHGVSSAIEKLIHKGTQFDEAHRMLNAFLYKRGVEFWQINFQDPAKKQWVVYYEYAQHEEGFWTMGEALSRALELYEAADVQGKES